VTLQPHEVVAVGCLILAAGIDARTGRIPNALNGLLLACGVAWWVIQGQWWVGLLGALAGFALHFPLWRLGVEKGGDAKLLIAFGAVVGWWEMLDATAWTALVYFPVGLGILAVSGKLPNVVAGVRYVLKRAQGVPEDAIERVEPTMLRTGPIIAVGGMLSLVWDILPS
jgi:Flp pilus assembly protein protease CpaA